MLRNASTAGQRERAKERERARCNYDGWDELHPDLLTLAALNLDANSLARLPQMCHSFRDAIAAESNRLWQPLMQATYPRAMQLLSLLPPPALSYKTVFADQRAAEKPADRLLPTPTCTLADFVFTIEIIRNAPAPFKVGDTVVCLASDDNIDMSGAPNPEKLLTFTKGAEFKAGQLRLREDRWWFAVNVGNTVNVFSRWYWAPCSAARQKGSKAKPQAMGPPEILRSWTGALTGPDPARFEIPLRWDELYDAWRSPGATPVRLRVFVSRLVHGQLRTLRCFLSETNPHGDWLDPSFVFWGTSLDHAQTFEDDEHALQPELSVAVPDLDAYENPEENKTAFEIIFEMYIPDVQTDEMTSNQLLRYLDYCLPWSRA